MTVTATMRPGVDEVTPADVLARVWDAEVAERRAGLAKLELALRWCLLHPVTAEPESGEDPAVWGDAGLPGMTRCEDTLGGQGAPWVAAGAPEPFAAALGVSTLAGMQVLADALDLAYRLPRAWAKVQQLAVAPWKARRLAQATHHLGAEAAGWVDARLAERLDGCGAVLVDRMVAQAAAVFDPASRAGQERAEDAARASWGVQLRHRSDGGFAGTSHLEAIGDTLDLTRFYDLVCDHAAHLATLGDTDTLGQRKAKALGLIADAQTHLDLLGITTNPDTDPVRRPSLTKTRAYLHLTLTDLITPGVLPDGVVGVGEVERLGPLTTARIQQWLGNSRPTIVPVLHLDHGSVSDRDGSRTQATWSVDVHDPPERMRELVILRDRHCVFPWCRVDARSCDLDHIDPYLPPDRGGPPGQTTPINLAPLCRRHHNAKTTRRWRYQRHPDGTYTWHSPHGHTYQVTALRTTRTDT